MTILAQAGAVTGATIAGMLCGIVFALTIGVLIGAVVLRFGFTIHNWLTADENHVGEPDFGRAALIVFVSALANLIPSFIVGFIVGLLMGNTREAGAIAQLLSLPISFLIFSAVLSQMVSVPFTRAMLITLCYFLAAICLALVIGVFVFGAILLVGALG